MKNLLFTTIALLLSIGLYGQPSARIAQWPYLQAVTDREFTVVWTTDIDAVSWVEVAPDDGTNFYATERPKYYQSEYGRRLIGKLHKVRVADLKPGTRYRYRVYQQAVICNNGNKRVILGEGYANNVDNKSALSVKTLDRARKEISFSMVNDIHSKDSLMVVLLGNVQKRGDDFVIFNGDMLSQMESEKLLFDGFLTAASKSFACNVPLYYTRGNHEGRGAFSYHYMDYFPSTTGQTYYTLRHGPAFIIVMDSGEDKPDSDIRYYGLSTSDSFREQQAKWLEAVVQSNEFKAAPIKIVAIHMPPNTNGWHGEREVHRLFVPILNRAGVDLMVCGHTHKYGYRERGTDGCNFPILINSNTDRAQFRVSETDIDIDIIDAKGAVLHQLKVKK